MDPICGNCQIGVCPRSVEEPMSLGPTATAALRVPGNPSGVLIWDRRRATIRQGRQSRHFLAFLFGERVAHRRAVAALCASATPWPRSLVAFLLFAVRLGLATSASFRTPDGVLGQFVPVDHGQESRQVHVEHGHRRADQPVDHAFAHRFARQGLGRLEPKVAPSGPNTDPYGMNVRAWDAWNRRSPSSTLNSNLPTRSP